MFKNSKYTFLENLCKDKDEDKQNEPIECIDCEMQTEILEEEVIPKVVEPEKEEAETQTDLPPVEEEKEVKLVIESIEEETQTEMPEREDKETATEMVEVIEKVDQMEQTDEEEKPEPILKKDEEVQTEKQERPRPLFQSRTETAFTVQPTIKPKPVIPREVKPVEEETPKPKISIVTSDDEIIDDSPAVVNQTTTKFVPKELFKGQLEEEKNRNLHIRVRMARKMTEVLDDEIVDPLKMISVKKPKNILNLLIPKRKRITPTPKPEPEYVSPTNSKRSEQREQTPTPNPDRNPRREEKNKEAEKEKEVPKETKPFKPEKFERPEIPQEDLRLTYVPKNTKPKFVVTGSSYRKEDERKPVAPKVEDPNVANFAKSSSSIKQARNLLRKNVNKHDDIILRDHYNRDITKVVAYNSNK
eukprot:CAMPEP_0170519724 /NCGR_PEP_ID=MMETSP0209-20121228/5031_1 /TAXON_ID=665100 ORGANISM="Litonotus pictus, Strain P1" /NCGR_SAMPLE_ID=MMETSP0209 /ASSEMBLY_ACC=CAM_ASM_000301 /LENGTH=415 /DNA_ID=CAMNT_0010805677 /DNA_START=367 /DNA_END=1614 /DNA_ORIENTATION=+